MGAIDIANPAVSKLTQVPHCHHCAFIVVGTNLEARDIFPHTPQAHQGNPPFHHILNRAALILPGTDQNQAVHPFLHHGIHGFLQFLAADYQHLIAMRLGNLQNNPLHLRIKRVPKYIVDIQRKNHADAAAAMLRNAASVDIGLKLILVNHRHDTVPSLWEHTGPAVQHAGDGGLGNTCLAGNF